MSIFVFDAYGTLFDVHAAIARHRQEMGPDADRISTVWRAKQLEYSWTLTLAGHYTDFWTLTERALDYALALVPGANQALRPKLLDAYFKLDAFPDARTTLKSLKAKGCKTGILSNGSPAMLKGAVDAAGIGSDLDALLSVDTLKMFKPRPEVYSLVTRTLRMQARRRHLRLFKPLGRDGRCFMSASAACGSIARNCPTSTLTLRRRRVLTDLNALTEFA